MPMWFVYILYSSKIDRYYTGVTQDITWRLERHNMGWGRYTKRGILWELKYTESYENKSDALKRERVIKKRSRSYIQWLLEQ